MTPMPTTNDSMRKAVEEISDTIEFNYRQPNGFRDGERKFWDELILKTFAASLSQTEAEAYQRGYEKGRFDSDSKDDFMADAERKALYHRAKLEGAREVERAVSAVEFPKNPMSHGKGKNHLTKRNWAVKKAKEAASAAVKAIEEGKPKS